MTKKSEDIIAVLDKRQLERIQALHRGFLYQHLYTAACLLRASTTKIEAIRVESDEDVEIIGDGKCHYVQVKTRSESLTFSDIEGALERFDAIRKEHALGRRRGSASFVIACNVAPSAGLEKQASDPHWPQDVVINWPESPEPAIALPRPWRNLQEALTDVAHVAAALPFAKLAGDTLTWKLAGCIQAAAAGLPPRADHSFAVNELPGLFEQLVVQLHDFPAPPQHYRPQVNEPSLDSEERIKIVCGLSGAGKTSWASQAALHTNNYNFYFDVGDTPGPALVSTVARELAGHLFANRGGRLGEILLPGATGGEILLAINKALARQGAKATLVIDNAHRISANDIRSLTANCDELSFVFLCQPSPTVQEAEALLSIKAVELLGWNTDDIAAEGLIAGCHGDYTAYDRLRILTGALPLYVQSALRVSKNEYSGDLARFCSDIEAQTHLTETAQEIILKRAVAEFETADRVGLGALALADIPLTRDEVTALLGTAASLGADEISSLLRRARTAGLVQLFGGDRAKVHDAARLIAQVALDAHGASGLRDAQIALKEILVASLPKAWSLQKLSQLMRLYVALGEAKTLINMATDELFHEMGVMPEIYMFLEQIADTKTSTPTDRFWALDGLVFSDLKGGKEHEAEKHLKVMVELTENQHLGREEQLALCMKRMIFAARKKRAIEVEAVIKQIDQFLPDEPDHRRIARYNIAHAMLELGKHEECEKAMMELIPEYLGVLGLTPQDIFMKNPDKIQPLLPKGRDNLDDCKHLADCMDLCAKAVNANGRDAGVLRIQALKFYALSHAFDSHFRVGQDLVDEFVGRHDYIGARDIFERTLLPAIKQVKLASHVIPIRSQYAVVLAYCGDFEAANTEMARLAPYEASLGERGRWELQNQRKLIAQLQQKAPPAQWIPFLPPNVQVRPPRKMRVNEPCYCGSGKKYKKCHGRN